MATETDAGKSLRAKFGRMFLASLSDPSHTPPWWRALPPASGASRTARSIELYALIWKGTIYSISKSSLQDKLECNLPRDELFAVGFKSPGDRSPFIRVPTKKHPKQRPGGHRQAVDDIVPVGRPSISSSKSA
jgi:hypothetical protein